jgi:CHRD domain/PEP-CTERM motif
MFKSTISFRPAAIAVAAVVAFAALPASAAPVNFFTSLTGAAEAPPNASAATGTAWISFDVALHTMRVVADFSGLSGPNTAAHIHCCTAAADAGTAGVATTTPTFPGFGLLLDGGHYDVTFDMTLASSYRAAFITANGGTTAGAEAALFQGMLDGKSYFNIHSQQFPAGEIRGFLHVPEPATYLLGLASLAMLGLSRRRRQR